MVAVLPKRHRVVPKLWLAQPHNREDGDMKDTMIGIDLAKNAFQVHVASMTGHVKCRKKLSRGQFFRFITEQPPALVIIEACGSAHYWARELAKAGHDVKLIAPQYVRPFVERQKNDAADAEAIVIAARQPEMRFVQPKTSEQQARAALFRARERVVRQRTELVNALRSMLYEYGQVIPLGIGRIKQIKAVIEGDEIDLPELVREECHDLLAQIGEQAARIEKKTKRLTELSRHSKTARRLQTMPGVGPVTALAIEAFAPAMENFRCGRDFAARLGLVPRQFSSGGRERLGRVSKAGQADIRRLIIIGAMACVNWASRKPPKSGSWLARILSRKPRMLVAVALANKMARTIWAMLIKNEDYRDPALAAAM